VPAFLRFFVRGIARGTRELTRDTVSRRSATRGALVRRPRRLVAVGTSCGAAARLQSHFGRGGFRRDARKGHTLEGSALLVIPDFTA